MDKNIHKKIEVLMDATEDLFLNDDTNIEKYKYEYGKAIMDSEIRAWENGRTLIQDKELLDLYDRTNIVSFYAYTREEREVENGLKIKGAARESAHEMLEIKKAFDEKGYLADTHTAVALEVYDQYTAEIGDTTPTVVVSTASPFKFSGSVLSALTEIEPEMGEFEIIDRLSEISGQPVPAPLAGLKDREIRFSKVCDRDALEQAVREALEIK